MGKEEIITPTPLCQEKLWKTIQGVVDVIQHIDNPWFSAAFVFTVTGNSVVAKDVNDGGLVELQKNRITVLTRPCIATITRHEIELYQCTMLRYAKGRWMHFIKYVVPAVEKEYYQAEELYEMSMQAFKKLVGHISDILNS